MRRWRWRAAAGPVALVGLLLAAGPALAAIDPPPVPTPSGPSIPSPQAIAQALLDGLGRALTGWLTSPDLREAVGAAAGELVEWALRRVWDGLAWAFGGVNVFTQLPPAWTTELPAVRQARERLSPVAAGLVGLGLAASVLLAGLGLAASVLLAGLGTIIGRPFGWLWGRLGAVLLATAGLAVAPQLIAWFFGLTNALAGAVLDPFGGLPGLERMTALGQWLSLGWVPGLGVLFVHHDRKGGGEYGEGVAGPNNLVGSTDVLIELKRIKGDPTARRMLVSRRFGDQDVTARLDGVRYVVGPAPIGDEADEAAPPAVPAHLQATLEAVRQAGPAGILRKDVQVVTGAAWATLSRQCRELRELGLIAEMGTGSKSDPFRCRLADAPPVAAPPTSDPEYVRYLNSAAWAAKRAEILDLAGGACEECDAEVEAGEMEVHHLTYERLYDERLEDLIGLCPGCHRRVPPPGATAGRTRRAPSWAPTR